MCFRGLFHHCHSCARSGGCCPCWRAERSPAAISLRRVGQLRCKLRWFAAVVRGTPKGILLLLWPCDAEVAAAADYSSDCSGVLITASMFPRLSPPRRHLRAFSAAPPLAILAFASRIAFPRNRHADSPASEAFKGAMPTCAISTPKCGPNQGSDPAAAQERSRQHRFCGAAHAHRLLCVMASGPRLIVRSIPGVLR